MEPAQRSDIHPELTWGIVGCAIEVHKTLGPGLLENTYRRCLVHELRLKGHRVTVEPQIPISYKGLDLGACYRADLVVNDGCLVELKAVEQIGRVHFLQTLTYLRLARLPIGLLINFNVPRLKDGIHRILNDRLDATQARLSAMP
jgi:GxxExxY protein